MLLIQNGRVLDPWTGTDAQLDVLIGNDGVIAKICADSTTCLTNTTTAMSTYAAETTMKNGRPSSRITVSGIVLYSGLTTIRSAMTRSRVL